MRDRGPCASTMAAAKTSGAAIAFGRQHGVGLHPLAPVGIGAGVSGH
jgi:hypothetical protein